MVTVTLLSCVVVVAILKTLPTDSVPVKGRNLFHKRNFDEEDLLNWNIDQLMGYKHRFEQFMDPDHNGEATFNEVKHFLRKYKSDVSDDQVRSFIRRRDTNGDHKIQFIPEYIVHITLPDYTPEAASEWFHLEDRNEDGIVSRPELLTIARQLGLSEPEVLQTVDGYYMMVDANHDRQLDWDEYQHLYMPSLPGA